MTEPETDVVDIGINIAHVVKHHAAYIVPDERETQLGGMEQERLASTGLLHHAVGDLAEFEVGPHRLRDKGEVAGTVNRVDELGDGVESHVVDGTRVDASRSPTWMAATPRVSEVKRTRAKPA